MKRMLLASALTLAIAIPLRGDAGFGSGACIGKDCNGGGGAALAADGEDIAGKAVAANDARINESTQAVIVYETSWTSGNCIAFAGAAGSAPCDQPGTEMPIPSGMTVQGVKVQHRGVARSATDQCLIEVLEKAPTTTGTGTLVDDVIYGDGSSNDPGDISAEVAMAEAIAAGGSIQLRISNYSTNTCTTLNGAVLVRLRQG